MPRRSLDEALGGDEPPERPAAATPAPPAPAPPPAAPERQRPSGARPDPEDRYKFTADLSPDELAGLEAFHDAVLDIAQPPRRRFRRGWYTKATRALFAELAADAELRRSVAQRVAERIEREGY